MKRRVVVGLLLGVALGLLPSASHTQSQPISALAPVEVVLDGAQELVGVAVAADGTLYISDRNAGTVLRLPPGNPLTVAVAGLDKPAGLALDSAGRLLIAEENLGRILRLEPAGTLTVLATGIKTPRWLAVSSDGSLYVSAHRLTAPDGADVTEGREILRLVPGVSLTVVATGIHHLEGLTRLNGFLVAATRGLQTEVESPGKLLRYPVLADGSLGAPADLVSIGLKRPVGIALDQLSALYASTKEITVGTADPAQRAIGKVHPDAHLSSFASNLGDPQGVALAPDGSLYLADGGLGRLLRFRAPPAPTLNALPQFTNQSPFTVGGTTEPNARVDIFVNDAAPAVTGTSDATGAFSVPVPLTPNAPNTLQVFATAHAGDGLTSAPAEATLTHDDIAPSLTFLDPPANAFVRQTVTVQAQATDSPSGVASVTLSADAQALTTTLSPAPPAASVTAAAPWDTIAFADGTHTLTAVGTDQAGNSATTTRSVIVDNTPPDTQITGGPAAEINTTEATFTFAGTDNLTPPQNLVFSWRLDSGPFTAFSAATTATLTGLTEGPHTFEVKARDQAGNEDPTPASRSFTVRLAPTITTVDPPGGPAGTLVTIHGTGFQPGATQVAFNGVLAALRSITTTTLATTVPIGSTTGLLTVTTPGGTASRTFSVAGTGDFALTAVPATASALQGGQATFAVSATGTGNFTGLTALSAAGLPAGVTATFGSAFLAPGQTGTLSLQVAAATPLGTVPFTLTGTTTVDGATRATTVPLTLQVLAGGRTALTGQILVVDGTPLPGARLTIAGQSALTDTAGAFLFLDLPAGTQTLSIDANVARLGFPIYGADVTLTPGQLTVLPSFRITPPPPPERFTPIQNATADQVITDPRFPGLSLTLPAGVTINGWDGQPKTRVALQRLRPDELPMPHPPFFTRSFYQIFFGTPMGGLPSAPLPISLPNDQGLAPGEKAEIWYYDAAPFPGVPGGWRLAGEGTVSADGTTVVPDPGVGIARFCGVCGTSCIRAKAEAQANVNPQGQRAGEPVDLATGLFVVDKTDLVLPGRLPAVVQRTYNPLDPFGGVAGFELSTGPGWTLSVDPVLLELGPSLRLLILPGNSRFQFPRQPDGTFVNATHPLFAGAVLRAEAGGAHSLRFKDGTTWRFASGWLPRGRTIPIAGLGLLVEQADRAGNRLTITRDQNGGITQLAEPGGRVVTFTTDPTSGRLSQIQDPLGRTVRYGYDALTRRLVSVTDPAGGETRYAYDAAGRIVSITDPRGLTFLATGYDFEGRVVRQVQADGGVWSFAYEGPPGAHTSATVTDPRGQVTVHRLRPDGFASEVIDPLGQATRTERDARGLVTAVTDPLGRVTRFSYDAAGNVTAITDPAGGVRTFTYEGTFNRVTSITDPLGQVTRFEYDLQGNLTAIVDPLGARTTIAYNTAGQPVSTTDPLGQTTTFGYDAVGNLVTITDPLGNTTAREYDAASRLVRQTDPRGKASGFAYDALNRLAQLTDALGGLTHFTYDGNGNLLFVVDARGSAISHAYDVMDRLVSRTDPVGAVETFEYDGGGNLVRHTDRKGQVATFTYDALNRRTGATYADGSTTAFTYDAGSRLVQASDSVGGTILNSYDVLDRLIAQTTGLGIVNYTYDALGRRTSMSAPGQASVFYGYDAASRLTQVVQGGQIVGLQYDLSGRRTRLTLPNGISTDYQYDAASRLTALIYRNAAALLGDLTYAYDPAGNRTAVGGSFARTLLPDSIASAAYNAANRQLTFGNKTMTFDANGNLTSLTDPAGITTLTWNARNQLSAISGPTSGAFLYDGLGRRVQKNVNGTVTDFLYDDGDVAQELAGGEPVNYVRSLTIDEALARGSEFYLADALGSTVALADPSAALTTQYTYTPFGQTTTTGAASTNPFGWTGREHDGPTGLYFLRARYYSPTLHRFISEDPLGLLAGDMNFYAYVGNNPINFTDPDGLAALVGGKIPSYCLERPTPPRLGGRKDPSFLESLQQAATKLGYGLLNLYLDVACDPSAGIPGPAALTGPAKAVGGKITGYTWHGIQRAISREGVGVSPRAILDAVKNPLKVVPQSSGTVKYIGKDATIVLTEEGQLVTGWATNQAGARIVPGGP